MMVCSVLLVCENATGSGLVQQQKPQALKASAPFVAGLAPLHNGDAVQACICACFLSSFGRSRRTVGPGGAQKKGFG